MKFSEFFQAGAERACDRLRTAPSGSYTRCLN